MGGGGGGGGGGGPPPAGLGMGSREERNLEIQENEWKHAAAGLGGGGRC